MFYVYLKSYSFNICYNTSSIYAYNNGEAIPIDFLSQANNINKSGLQISINSSNNDMKGVIKDSTIDLLTNKPYSITLISRFYYLSDFNKF